MHAGGESDGCTVPSKRPNKGGQLPAEGAEGRQPTKENIGRRPRAGLRAGSASGATFGYHPIAILHQHVSAIT
jgi:hypothetical protein